jgi:hypothetical protein
MIHYQQPTAAAPAAPPDDSIVARMADKMLVLAMNNVSATADLLGEDFSEAEIEANWRAARDLARQHAVRRLA